MLIKPYVCSYGMDRNGPCKSRGSIIMWIRKEKPSGFKFKVIIFGVIIFLS